MKVLCIDDSLTIRMLVKKALSPEGYEVQEAENGQDALDNISTDISLIIVDVNMPIMSGYEFVEEIKKNSAYENTPIIFLTTESSEEKKLKGKRLGTNGWMVKPFEPSALIKVVKMLTG